MSGDGFKAGPIVGHWQHGFALRRLKLETGATIPAHARAEQEVIFVQSGTLEFNWDGGKLIMGAGDTLTVPVGLMHGFRNPASADAIAFVVRGAAGPCRSGLCREPRGGRVMGRRIQTTHVGSLPRTKQITDLVFAREAGVPIDEAGFNAIVGGGGRRYRRAAEGGGRRPAVRRRDEQDQLCDLHQGPADRLCRRQRAPARPRILSWCRAFSSARPSSGGTPSYKRPKCVGEIAVKTHASRCKTTSTISSRR